MSISHKTLNKKKKKLILETLFASARKMQKDNPVEYFITTLLTESEQITIGRRILIAQMILAGKTQSEISYFLQVSPNTYTRTRKWLDGQIPNYSQALEEYNKKQAQKVSSQKKTTKIYVDSTSFSGLRKKFPAHFLLFNVTEELLKKISK